MKKRYIKPAWTIVLLKTPVLLSGSPDSLNSVVSDSDALSRKGFNSDDDND